MLYTGPISYDLGDRAAKVYEPHRDPYTVKAFHWGSLTAGRPHTAFWILLAPFALANVSGWMSERANPWTRALIRVAGLTLTGVFFAQIADMTMSIPYETRLRHAEHPEVWGALLLISTAALTLLGLTIVSTQSNFARLPIATRLRLVFSPVPDHMRLGEPGSKGGWEDPAYDADVLSEAMWSPQPIVHRLRRLHLSAGAFVLALVAGSGIGNQILVRASVGGLVLTVFLVLSTTWIPRSLLFARLPTALLPTLAVAWLAVTAWAIWTSRSVSGLAAADQVTFALALMLLVFALFALFGEWVKGGPLCGWVSLGALAVALLVGASLGLTGGLLVEDYLSPSPGLRTFARGGAWTALVMAGLTLVLLAMAAVMAAVPLPGVEGAPGVAPESKLRRVTARSRGLLAAAGIYGVAAGIATALAACATGPGCDSDRLPVPAWATEDPEGVVEAFALSFDLSSVLGWVKLVIVVLPGVLILRSIIGGLIQGQETRRKVSILWDIGSFWPRWYHPLAPPAYGPSAVTTLSEEISVRQPDIVSAHSQGSLIAAASIAMASPMPRAPLLITYGSPLGILYRSLFAQVGLDRLIETADRAVEGRWLNLWRRSDPIGGRQLEPLGERNWHVDTGSGHSRYELTPEYCAARERGLADRWARPPQHEIATCWERITPG
jgi:hypothetical protein